MNSYKKVATLLLSSVFLLGVVYGLNTVTSGRRVIKNAAAVTIDAHGICRNVSSTCSQGDIFVPTNTTGEWTGFIANKPSCVNLTACAIAGGGNGGGSSTGSTGTWTSFAPLDAQYAIWGSFTLSQSSTPTLYTAYLSAQDRRIHVKQRNGTAWVNYGDGWAGLGMAGALTGNGAGSIGAYGLAGWTYLKPSIAAGSDGKIYVTTVSDANREGVYVRESGIRKLAGTQPLQKYNRWDCPDRSCFFEDMYAGELVRGDANSVYYIWKGPHEYALRRDTYSMFWGYGADSFSATQTAYNPFLTSMFVARLDTSARKRSTPLGTGTLIISNGYPTILTGAYHRYASPPHYDHYAQTGPRIGSRWETLTAPLDPFNVAISPFYDNNILVYTGLASYDAGSDFTGEYYSPDGFGRTTVDAYVVHAGESVSKWDMLKYGRDGKLYAIVGFASGSDPSAISSDDGNEFEIWSMSPPSGTWTKVASVPLSLYDNGGTEHVSIPQNDISVDANGKIYLLALVQIGDRTEGESVVLYSYDPTTHTRSTEYTLVSGINNAGQLAVQAVDNTTVYAHYFADMSTSSSSVDYVTPLVRYNPSTHAITDLAAPSTVWSHASNRSRVHLQLGGDNALYMSREQGDSDGINGYYYPPVPSGQGFRVYKFTPAP